MSVKILDEITINKIAAGEVVERPANVVKELVDNALDAGADTVSVEIGKAGKRLIRICDNGCGMSKEDLLMSIKRHATSKISSFEDLSSIVSLGFRGEALPSIASVSMFNIKTYKKNEPSGWELSVAGGENIDIKPWTGAGGTIVEATNLFFNTPVREKFMKSDATEKSKILSSIDEVALVANEVNFKVISDGKTVADYKKTDSKIKRIEDVLGKENSSKLKYIHFDNSQISVDAYITLRNNAIAHKNLQYLFVNDRCVNYPKWLMSAINQASKQTIPVGRYIGLIMFITANPEEIDVNVHPTKREVKFAYENKMYEMFYSFIKSSLESDAPADIFSVSSLNNDNIAEKKLDDSSSKSFGTNITNDIKTSSFIKNDYFKNNENKFKFSSGSGTVKTGSSFVPSKMPSLADYKNLYATQPSSFSDVSIKTEIKEIGNKPLQQEVIKDESFRFVGQIFLTYILVEKEDMFYIIDQHAAQERIKYEMFTSQIENNKLAIQQLLIPEVFDLSASKAVILKDKSDHLKKLGFTIEEFGDNSFRLLSYPALLGTNVKFFEIIDILINYFIEEKTATVEQIEEKVIRTACRSSIKAGDKMQAKQAEVLLKDLFLCKMPWTCPHGRPTVYKLSNNDLRKFFKRT